MVHGFAGYYVEGVSLTHGQNGNRTHIWTFAGSLAEVYGIFLNIALVQLLQEANLLHSLLL